MNLRGDGIPRIISNTSYFGTARLSLGGAIITTPTDSMRMPSNPVGPMTPRKLLIVLLAVAFSTSIVFTVTTSYYSDRGPVLSNKQAQDEILDMRKIGFKYLSRTDGLLSSLRKSEGFHDDSAGTVAQYKLRDTQKSSSTRNVINRLRAEKAKLDRYVTQKYSSRLLPLFQNSIVFSSPEDKAIVLDKLMASVSDSLQGSTPYAQTRMVKFTVVVTGTSVSAAHDVYFNQSYAHVFQRALDPILNVLGVNLDVMNHAMGNNPLLPYGSCLSAHVGDNVDLVVWEQAMMLERPFPWGVEAFLRSSLSLPTSRKSLSNSLPSPPAVLFAKVFLDMDEVKRKEYFSVEDDAKEIFWDAKGDLRHHYSRQGIHYLFIGPTVFREAKSENRLFTAERLNTADKPGKKGAHWHPGPHGHELFGLMMAESYATALIELLEHLAAVEDVKSEIESIPSSVEGESRARKELEAYLNAYKTNALESYQFFTKPEIAPEPLYCDDHIFCRQSAQCFTTYSPQSPLSRDLTSTVLVPKSLADHRPQVRPSLGKAESDEWHVKLWPNDVDAVWRNRHYQYLDLKWALQGNRQSGALLLSVELKESGRIWLCRPPGIWDKDIDGVGNLTHDAIYQIDSQNVSFIVPAHAKYCIELDSDVSAGLHKVSMTCVTDRICGLSHIIHT